MLEEKIIKLEDKNYLYNNKFEQEGVSMKDRRKLLYIIPFLILLLILLTFISILSSCSESSTEVKKVEAETEKVDILFDIPSLLDKNAWEIKETLEKTHGEPDIFNEPFEDDLGEVFGTLNWTRKIGETENSLFFGFDFYKDGRIADNVFVLTAVREKGEPELSLSEVLEAGNLDMNSNKYKIEIITEKEDMINLWIIKN